MAEGRCRFELNSCSGGFAHQFRYLVQQHGHVTGVAMTKPQIEIVIVIGQMDLQVLR